MKNKKTENAKVGLFVIAGLLFLVFTLYMIGRNQNMFRSTFTIKAVTNNVNGLVPGNNVRFKGLDIGTVKAIEMVNDTAIHITLLITNSMKPFIKKNAITSISTDGLMGNKLVQINPQEGLSAPVAEGDVIFAQKTAETDEMLQNLHVTSDFIEKSALNLYEITTKLNHSESLWALLSDTAMTTDLKSAVAEFRQAGRNSNAMTYSGKNLLRMLEEGNGLVNRVFSDTILSRQLTTSLDEIQRTSHAASLMVKDLEQIVAQIEQGKGPAGLLLKDSLFRETLLNSALNIEQGTDNFNQNMEALKRNFLFRRYFRKLEKQKEKAGEE